MSRTGSSTSLSPAKKRALVLIAVSLAVLGACLFLVQMGEDDNADKSGRYVMDNILYEVVSAQDMTVKVTGYEGKPTAVVIPDEIMFNGHPYKVVSIGMTHSKSAKP